MDKKYHKVILEACTVLTWTRYFDSTVPLNLNAHLPPPPPRYYLTLFQVFNKKQDLKHQISLHASLLFPFQRSGVAWISKKRVARLSGGARLEYSSGGFIDCGFLDSLPVSFFNEFSPSRFSHLPFHSCEMED